MGRAPHSPLFLPPHAQVVPPPGWRPRRDKFPDLNTVHIQTPIRQYAYGSKGAYRWGGARAPPRVQVQRLNFKSTTRLHATSAAHRGPAACATTHG